jgi:hypothetical protein
MQFKKFNLMGKSLDEGQTAWSARLLREYPQEAFGYRQSIVRWLLGKNLQQFDRLTPEEFAIARQGIDYRYRILRQRYLMVNSIQAYHHLIYRLSSSVMVSFKFRTWVAQSSERQKAMVDLLSEVMQDLLEHDPEIQQQIAWIAQCTQDSCLANALLLASLEEYCLRPFCNQPLLICHLVSFLRRQGQSARINSWQQNLLDLLSSHLSWEQTQIEQTWEEQQIQRLSIQAVFESYLVEKVGRLAVDWLRLHLQGRSPQAIAQSLDLSIKQVERLQKTVGYHGTELFALQEQTAMEAPWLA